MFPTSHIRIIQIFGNVNRANLQLLEMHAFISISSPQQICEPIIQQQEIYITLENIDLHLDFFVVRKGLDVLCVRL